MHSNELPLITFTLIAQLAVGAVVGLTIAYHPLQDRVGQGRASDLVLIVLATVLVLLAIAGAAATAHLGNVRNVYLVLSNWRSSWLSREILAVAAFGATVVLFGVVTMLDGSGTSGLLLAGGLASVVGLVLVATIAKLYMLRTVPVWNRLATPVTFFLSTAILGFAGVALAAALVDDEATITIWRAFGLLAVLAAGMQIATFQIHRRRLSDEVGAAKRSGDLMSERLADVARSRNGLTGLAVVVGFVTLWGPVPPAAGVAVVGMLLVASEIIGRYIFYASYVREGL